MIRYSIDGQGVAVLIWDLPDSSTNVLNETSIAAFAHLADRAIADPAVKGIVIASGKDDFIVGADLTMLKRFADGDLPGAQDFYRDASQGNGWHAVLRRLETCGKPVVAAINGSALGGGLELCLACHRRIVADDARTELGLPEVTLGLLPAGGGTQRLGRLLGWKKAADLLLTGKRLSPADARNVGIVDDVVPATELMNAAREWIANNATATQPWDRKGYKLPGGGLYEAGDIGINALITQAHVSTQGNAPAPLAILRCLHDGLRASFEAGLQVECRELYALLKNPVAGNMIRSSFFNMQKARKLKRRPPNVAKHTLRKVGVLGAGMMGSGIALVTARAGIRVVLLDRDQHAAEQGKLACEQALRKAVDSGRATLADQTAFLSRIHPTAEYADLDGCDLVIEAVFEDRAIKADVTRRAEAVIAPEALLGSNTSTLPITGLAESSCRPERFIGLHFFSPVERMQLVEIICGAKTSPATLAHALDYVQQIGKIPIIVNDSRGFYTSRVFGTYTREAIHMLAQGVPAALIENLGRATGMPVPPLALLDEISLDLVLKVRKQTERDLGDAFVREPIDVVASRMVEKLQRPGRKAGRGFYEYTSDSKRLWPQLHAHFPLAKETFDYAELKKQFLYIQALESARCVDEGVITDAGDADIGAILGWGFPAHTGGPLSLIDTIGVSNFVAECDSLAARHGERFQAPKLLREMARTGARFHARNSGTQRQSSTG